MTSQPNVVIVITHDTGRRLGVYGRRVATPSLDRLAREGVVFGQAYCAAPQCSPSRASLLTGLAPHSNGLVGLTHRGFRLHPEMYRRTLPSLLGAAGYRTALFGFQHEAPDARDLGYQEVRQPVGTRHHLARDVAPMAAAYLANHPPEPFLVVAGFDETHRPFDPTDTPLDDVDVPPSSPLGSPLEPLLELEPPAEPVDFDEQARKRRADAKTTKEGRTRLRMSSQLTRRNCTVQAEPRVVSWRSACAATCPCVGAAAAPRSSPRLGRRGSSRSP